MIYSKWFIPVWLPALNATAYIKKEGRTSSLMTGQVRDGYLYMKHRSSSKKTGQMSAKSYSNANSTLKALIVNKVEITKLEYFNFIHPFSSSFSFFFVRHDSKSIQSLWILNKPNDYSVNLLHSSLFWALCELPVRMMSYGLKLSPKSLHIHKRTLLGLSHNNCAGMACMVATHGLLSACCTDCYM